MSEEFPLPHTILDIWRVHLCDVMTHAYGGLCRHDYSDRSARERAKETEIKDHEMCLWRGQEAIREQSWMELFMSVLVVTSTYPHSDNQSSYNSKYESVKTRAEENALAAVGYYCHLTHKL